MENLLGIIERVTYHNQQNGWSVIKIRPLKSKSYRFNEDQLVTVVIHQASIHPGATMNFEGSWVEHPSFGTQFKAQKATEQKPADVASLERYLGSGMIKGIGPSTAKKIVKRFGIETLEVFEGHIERLKEIKGITEKKLKEIKISWETQRSIKDLMIFLQDHGVSTLLATKIFKTYGNNALKVLQENPYKLARDITGIGFFTADQLASKLGLDPQSTTRYRAGINHVLFYAREDGHCYLFKEQISNGVAELLFKNDLIQFNKSLFENELAEMLKEKQFVRRVYNEQECFFAHVLDRDEAVTAKRIIEISGMKNVKTETAFESWIQKYSSLEKIKLSEEQLAAVKGIATHKVAVLTGGPGCGKTTTTKTIVQLALMQKKQVVLAAPTGRAAQRMSEVIGLNAQTIHRLLAYDPNNGGFKFREDNPLSGDFFILDECSMLDISLISSFLKAVPNHAQILLIGDIDQLPAVGPGNVLKDIINSKAVAVYRLSKIFRQGSESSIITAAHEINHGVNPKIASPFQYPELWKNKAQSLFIDCEELTKDQVRLIQKIKFHYPKWKESQTLTTQDTEAGEISKDELFRERFLIPAKWDHVSLEDLVNTQDGAEEVKAVLKKINPYSAIHYGLTSQQILLKIVKEIIPKYWGNELEIQVLAPMHKGSLGTAQLNELLQDGLNINAKGSEFLTINQRKFFVGDRVIHKKNNYDLDVYNGDIGKIVALDVNDQTLEVEYKIGKNERYVRYEKENLLELDLAYTISIHKSQGSEFDVVIIPIATQHFALLNRNLIYTGLTRAKKLVIFLGSRKALAMAVQNIDQHNRQTLLKERLQELI
jgi:exodeoxyribonuclease V alpha subunit